MADDDTAIAPESAPSLSIAGLSSVATHEFIRYFAASALALAADVGTLWFLTSILGLFYLLSAAIAFSIGVVIVYTLSITWVFDARRMKDPRVEFLAFLLIGIIGLGINEVVLYLLTGMFGLYYLASKIVSVVIVFSWNFIARKVLLFSHSRAS